MNLYTALTIRYLKENKKVIEFLDLIFVKKENYVNEYI